MQTKLIDIYQRSPDGVLAENILRSCVHCGFCNATCPSYQVLGNELDGPRGRIYLIKQMLEGQPVTEKTRLHLDRCLSCQSCETTCPSGVEYHRLLNIGRGLIDQKLDRPAGSRLHRSALVQILTRPALFSLLLRLGRMFRPLLPQRVKQNIPLRQSFDWNGSDSANLHKSDAKQCHVYIHQGCVQDALAPEINAATRAVFGALGFSVQPLEQGCCAAIEYHLDFQSDARVRMKSNIDRWLRQLDTTPDACIVSNASGCGAFLKDYAGLLHDDSEYLEKARMLAAKVRDPAEILDAQALAPLVKGSQVIQEQQVVVFQSPCTLQHGQQLSGVTEAFLRELGLAISVPRDAHLCCGSAGTYSMFNAEIADSLKQRKLETLHEMKPEHILTANIGCQTHLNSKSPLAVKHWLVLLAEMLTEARFKGSRV